MLRFNRMFFQNACGKILQIERDDDSGLGANRSREHVTIVRVRQRQPFNQILISNNKTVSDGLVDQDPCSSQPIGR